MSRFTGLLTAVLAVLLFGVAYYQGQNTKLKRDVAEISNIAKQQQSTIETMTAQRELAAQLDKKYAQELADAKIENDKLRADIDSGAKRLRVNATCKSVSDPSKTPGVDDATSPRLDDAAQRDYLNLRERIGTATKQITGLQEYILQFCSR